ncbi:MAG: homoaconitase [Ignavibacteriales bacterium]|nr:homoaconitase [Ignavibacteriales bacterium]
MAQNLIEKIAQKHAFGWDNAKEVHSGEYLSIQPAYIMTHDNTGAVIPKFKSIGATKLFNPSQVVVTLDHNVQDNSEANLAKYKKIEAFAKEMGANFFPAGRGIGHQIMCEEGFAFPGTMAVASDSHSNMYGGLGCLGTPIVRTDAASIWATGRTWWQVPPVIKVVLTGTLHPGISGKDVIVALCGLFNKDEVLNAALEFTGEAVSTLTIDDRLTIANMTTEWGALAGVFPVDMITVAWLQKRLEKAVGNPRLTEERIDAIISNPPRADKDAIYAKEITLALDTVIPCVSGPDTVKVMKPVSYYYINETPIQKAYLLSCVNGRTQDFVNAAEVMKGQKVADSVKMYIAAASNQVQEECEQNGSWQTLIDAGAIALSPGCGSCIGLGVGLLEDGEVGISATNRNFKGRMGSPKAKAFLASPVVVATSAIAGKIAYSHPIDEKHVLAGIIEFPKSETSMQSVEIMDDFPTEISGPVLFCRQDNMNTDGIYPGKYTYLDDFTPEQQASVVMENYDPEFRNIAQAGDILVGGFNFGTGSSREQAATALKYKGIQLLIAGTFNETYKRNALNNGFLLIECPDLVNDLKNQAEVSVLTMRFEQPLKVDILHSVITFKDKVYRISPIGLAAQELIIAGGLEKWVQRVINA